MAVLAVALGIMVSGCYGPFTLVRKVYNWNGQVSDNKWVVELVYLVCTWLPVYGIAGAADAIIFNSVVFWTGKSMLADDASTQTKRIVRKDTETILTRMPGPEGDELWIQQTRQGEPVANLRIRRQGDALVAMNAEGATLFTADTLADGRVVITDANGLQVAEYSEDQAKQLLASVPSN
jgi:hypothetical protein